MEEGGKEAMQFLDLNSLRAGETHAFVAFYEITSVVKVELFV